jgi:transposase-like protein
MTNNITTPFMPQLETKATADLFDNWFDPVEAGLRDRAREFLQAMLEAELDEVLGRSRYVRGANNASRRMEEHAHRKARWDAGLPYWTDEGLENL